MVSSVTSVSPRIRWVVPSHLLFLLWPLRQFRPVFRLFLRDSDEWFHQSPSVFSFISLGIPMNGFVSLLLFLLVFGWFCPSSWPLPSSSLVVVSPFDNLVLVSSSNLLPNDSHLPSFTLCHWGQRGYCPGGKLRVY